jgi:hypothetical protein
MNDRTPFKTDESKYKISNLNPYIVHEDFKSQNVACAMQDHSTNELMKCTNCNYIPKEYRCVFRYNVN